jgi:hypothetical protein
MNLRGGLLPAGLIALPQRSGVDSPREVTVPSRFSPFRFVTRRLPVWPYFFLGTIAVVFGGLFVVLWWPEDLPQESDLVMVSGDIASISVRDDISDSSAGAILPAMTSVYFKLEGVDGEFRYPFSHPQYSLVRNHTAVRVDLWVRRDDIGGDEPMTIWQIQEHNPYREPYVEETFVSRDEIVARLTRSGAAMVRFGAWLLAAAGALLLFGFWVRRHNRKLVA